MGRDLLPYIHQSLDEKKLTPEFVQQWGKIMFCHGYIASYVFDDTDDLLPERNRRWGPKLNLGAPTSSRVPRTTSAPNYGRAKRASQNGRGQRRCGDCKFINANRKAGLTGEYIAVHSLQRLSSASDFGRVLASGTRAAPTSCRR